MKIERIMELKKRIQKMQRERDKSRAALQLAQSELEKEFGCRSLREAQRLKTKLTKKVEELASEIEGKVEELASEIEGKVE